MFKYLLSAVTLEEIKGLVFGLSTIPLGVHRAARGKFSVTLANLVFSPSCRLFYGVSMRINFKSETCLIHSKYIFPNRVAKKKYKSSTNSIDF